MSLPSMTALLPIVLAAGEVARGYVRNVAAERKPDRTLVTAADRAVEEFLVERLLAAAPGTRILGEEFGAAGTAGASCMLTLDPIDGTAAFVSGLPTWCITLGLVEDGSARGGITHLPMTGETYVAEGGVATWNGRVIPPGRHPPAVSDAFLVTYSGYHRGTPIGFKGKVRSLGSTAYHMALVARGAAVAALLGRPRIWDIAAGAALLEAVEGALRYESGASVALEELRDGELPRERLVAAGPGMIDDILALLGGVERR